MDFKLKDKDLERKLRQIMVDNDLKFYEELIRFILKKAKL
jgi:hypothetical protein